MNTDTILKLNRDQLESLVRAHNANGYKEVVPVGAKARKYCAENVVAWNRPVNDAINAVLRAIRRQGPWDSLKTQTCMAAIELAAIAEQAKEGLEEKELRLLTDGVYAVLAEVDPNQSTGWSAPVGDVKAEEKKATGRKKAQQSKPEEGVNPAALKELTAQIKAASPDPEPVEDLFGEASFLDPEPTQTVSGGSTEDLADFFAA